MHVVLIHGLGRTPLSMTLLGWRLSKRGHIPHYFGYAAFCETFSNIQQRFVNNIYRTVVNQPYALVGHSLGSLLARASLPDLADMPPSCLVMLAPPNRPPLLARRLKANPIYRLVAGDCGRILADLDFYERLPQPTIPTTVIAGTAGPRGRHLLFGMQLNDGILSVEETRLSTEGAVIMAPLLHRFIMNCTQVTQLICTALDAVKNEKR